MKQDPVIEEKDNQDPELSIKKEMQDASQNADENSEKAPNPEQDIEEIEQELIILRKQVQEKEAIVEEYLSMLQRLQAEFQNYKKRVERERSEVIEQATKDLVFNLLSVLDNFERALQSDASDTTSFKKGIEMIFKQLKKVLEAEGLSPIPAVGEPFDPYYHEAVLTAVGEYEEDIILEELEKGYLLKKTVLRPSKVKVGKRGD
ncbi:MAG: nucleotide exchange factor GrpE [Candidatus Thorarchaeota archaeon]|jgi:molecular chaperone GrpE